MKKWFFASIFGVVILGGFLRFWKLAEFPVSLSIDEVALGYNSYSILETGKDEYGKLLPLSFRSIGDYKPPVLFYLMTPAIKFFGLNEFGIRCTVAFFGTLTLLVVYLLVYEISKNKVISVFSSLSLAISPWHIQFSRGTFEAITALFFMLLGVYFFLKSINSKRNYFIFSAVFFILSMYSYHAEKVATPLLITALFIIYRKELFLYKKQTITAFLLALILAAPFIYQLFGPEGQARAVSVFVGKDFLIRSQLHTNEVNLSFIQRILDNNFIILGNFWLKRYLDYWDPGFLFFKGMNLTLPGYPDVGLFHLFEIVPFAVGIWYFLFNKKSLFGKKEKLLVIVWWLIGSVAASLANNAQHPLRSLTSIPILQMMIGVGGYLFFKKAIFLLIAPLILLVSLVYYFDIYYIHSPVQFSEYNSYGYKEISQYLWENKDKYQEVVFDPSFGSRGQNIISTPYLYLLVYGKYNPKLFQQVAHRTAWDSTGFDKFTFRSIYWPTDKEKHGTLFVGSPWSLPPDDLGSANILKRIYFKNGVLGFLIVEVP